MYPYPCPRVDSYTCILVQRVSYPWTCRYFVRVAIFTPKFEESSRSVPRIFSWLAYVSAAGMDPSLFHHRQRLARPVGPQSSTWTTKRSSRSTLKTCLMTKKHSLSRRRRSSVRSVCCLTAGRAIQSFRILPCQASSCIDKVKMLKQELLYIWSTRLFMKPLQITIRC